MKNIIRDLGKKSSEQDFLDQYKKSTVWETKIKKPTTLRNKYYELKKQLEIEFPPDKISKEEEQGNLPKEEAYF